MKKLCKNLILFFIVLLLLPVTAWADSNYGLNEWFVDTIEQQNQAIESLQKAINDLRNNPQVSPSPRPQDPNIKLTSSPTITADKGEVLEIELVVKNIGTSTAHSILTQAEAAGPFSVEFLNNSNTTDTINENASHTIKMRITVDNNAKPDNYRIKLNHSFRTANRTNKNTTDEIFFRITGTDTSPNVVLNAFRTDRAHQVPGGNFALTVPIQNMGDAPARNVRISLEISEQDLKTVRPTSDINNAQFNAMAAGYTGTLNFSFSIDEKAKNGTYPIHFNVAYKDESGEDYKEVFTYFLTINVETEKSAVEIRDMKSPGSTIELNGTGLFSFMVYNASPVTARNIRVSLIDDYDKTAIVPKSDDVHLINSLPAETGRLVTFSLAPTFLSETRSYTIGFLVEYETPTEEETQSVRQYASMNVRNPEADKKNEENTVKPRMIVSEYTVDPSIALAGQEFELSITFQNASSVKAVNNIKITLEAFDTTETRGAVFTPVGGSNTFFIDHLNPKEEVRKVLRMSTVPDADARQYKLDVKFDYQDEDFNSWTEPEQIGINVKQTTRLEISEPHVQDMVTPGQRVSLWFSVFNSGRVSLSNVRVRVEGDFDAREADMIIGNLGRGANISYDGIIIPNTPGMQEGTVIVSGEDAMGDIIESKYTFTLNVMDMEMGGGDEMWFGEGREGMVIEGGDFGYIGGGWDMMQGEENMIGTLQKAIDFMKKPYFWGPLLLVMVGLVVAVALLIRRNHNKKAVDFDE